MLQKASVKIINDTVCNEVTEGQLTSRMLCSGFLLGGVDACQVRVGSGRGGGGPEAPEWIDSFSFSSAVTTSHILTQSKNKIK